MDEKELQIIKELMEELQGHMEPGAEEIEERLGRPKAVAIKIEGEQDPALEKDEEKYGMDLDGDNEMLESPEHKLKQRILKLRG